MSDESPAPRQTDRYGFYVRPSERLALEISPLKRPNSEIPYAFTLLRTETKSVDHKHRDLERLRLLKWQSMLTNWDKFCKRNPKVLKRRCRKGIPDAVRGTAWRLISARDEKNKLTSIELVPPRATGSEIGAAASTASTQNSPYAIKYSEWLTREPEDPKIFDVIDRDIDRTFPRHAMFREASGIGQIALRRVLRAYAAFDPEVGYCQGMGFIAGMFLSYMREEAAFDLLQTIMRSPKFAFYRLFNPSMERVLLTYHQFEYLLKRKVPGVAAVFQKHNVITHMYGGGWFLTGFVGKFPFALVTRIWDAFLLEGWKVFHRVGLALLHYVQDEFKRADGLEQIMDLMRELPTMVASPAAVDAVMTKAFALHITSQELLAAEKHYTDLLTPRQTPATPPRKS